MTVCVLCWPYFVLTCVHPEFVIAVRCGMLWHRYGQKLDFHLLDRQNGAGWDLVCKLLTPKKSRISVSAAMAHRFFRPDGLSSVGLQPSGSKTLTKS